jgi:hypothetical protein
LTIITYTKNSVGNPLPTLEIACPSASEDRSLPILLVLKAKKLSVPSLTELKLILALLNANCLSAAACVAWLEARRHSITPSRWPNWL